MGTFLSMSSVVGKTKREVVSSLTNYAKSLGGGFQRDENINPDVRNYAVVEEANGNTSVFYPDNYLGWDDSAAFLSKELNAKVFSFHIHDGDLWMYVFYDNGQVIDQFNPVPDYWEEDISEEEIDSWKGNAQIIANAFPFIKASDIDQYLVRWNLEEDEPSKAYPTDEFAKEDWQLLDFMTKLKLPYPLDDDGNPKGESYKLWTSKEKLKAQQFKSNLVQAQKLQKPWWKFW